jgi:hypothetical protein
MIKLLLGKILCLLKFKSIKQVKVQETVLQERQRVEAKFVKDIRIRAWQERRRVIVEKHKDIKDYVLSIKYLHTNNEPVRVLEFQSSDSKYESLKESLMKTCADNEITEDRVSIKCLNVKNEEIPDMFLL